MQNALSTILISLALAQDAHAYIDPGSSILLLQGLLAALGAALVFIKHPIAAIKRLLKRGRDEE